MKYWSLLIIIILLKTTISDINIHVIPHSHMDPGWGQTFEGYYRSRVVNVYNTMLRELTNGAYVNEYSSKRTFVVCEISFFIKWYREKSKEEREKIKELIYERRIEIVLGGWTSNDEANTIYYNMMDNIRYGQQIVYEEFNIIPKTGWFLDPFGHSAGNAYVMKLLDIENLYIERIHYSHKDLLIKTKNTEYYWKPFESSGKEIFTHVQPHHYDIISDGFEYGKSKEQLTKYVFDHIAKFFSTYRHKEYFFIFGGDFKFQTNRLFKEIEGVMEYVNNFDYSQGKFIHNEVKEKVNMFYSTPDNYFNAIKNYMNENNKEFETIDNFDYFPYSDEPTCYWTGYFTSRPYLKGHVSRNSNALYTFSNYYTNLIFSNYVKNRNILELKSNIYNNLNKVREVVALLMHHDAITGTCYDHVSNDYIEKMKSSLRSSEQDFVENINSRFNFDIKNVCYNNHVVNQQDCGRTFTISDNKNNELILGLYNPGKTGEILINIEVTSSDSKYIIENIPSDFFCLDKVDKSKYPNRCFLNFFYKFTEFENYVTFKIIKTKNSFFSKNYLNDLNGKIDLIKQQGVIRYLIYDSSNNQFSLEYRNDKLKIINVKFNYYDGYYKTEGYSNDKFKYRCKDGHYLFTPYNSNPIKVNMLKEFSFFIKGNLGIIFVTRNEDLSFSLFYIFIKPFFIKVEHLYDNLSQSESFRGISFESGFVFQTDINNVNEGKKKTEFYTDSNGLEMMKRIKDNYPFGPMENTYDSYNYYPVTTFISIEDIKNDDNKITIFNDRAQGGSSLMPGSIILLIQKKSNTDDNRGLGQGITESASFNTNHFKVTHFIVFGNTLFRNYMPNMLYSRNLYQNIDIIKFTYQYFNTGILLFKINNKENLYKLQEENRNFLNYFKRYITLSNNIRDAYYLIHKNLLIGEYFKYSNDYFNKKLEMTSFEGLISLRFPKDTQIRIKTDTKGIDYKFDELPYNEGILSTWEKPYNLDYIIESNDYIYIYFYFQ